MRVLFKKMEWRMVCRIWLKDWLIGILAPAVRGMQTTYTDEGTIHCTIIMKCLERPDLLNAFIPLLNDARTSYMDTLQS